MSKGAKLLVKVAPLATEVAAEPFFPVWTSVRHSTKPIAGFLFGALSAFTLVVALSELATLF